MKMTHYRLQDNRGAQAAIGTLGRVRNVYMIPVLIVEEHPIFAEGLRALLETQGDLQVVAVVDHSADVPELVAETSARIVLLDLGLPDDPGPTLCSAILSRNPSTRVVILSADDTDEAITGALAAGASGYILKTEEPDQIIAAVRAASRGETVLPGPVAQKVVRQLLERHRAKTTGIPDHLTPLTEREREVFDLAAQGYRNSEIAHRLVLSEETIKTHLRNIYNKLGLTNKTELRLFAMQSNQSRRR